MGGLIEPCAPTVSAFCPCGLSAPFSCYPLAPPVLHSKILNERQQQRVQPLSLSDILAADRIGARASILQPPASD